MGGSLCARRSPNVESKQSGPASFADKKTETKVKRERAGHPPVVDKKSETKDLKKVESKAAVDTSAQLPTKSWSALLKEAPLNASAKPFHPTNLQGLQSFAETLNQVHAPPGLAQAELPPSGLSIDSVKDDKIEHEAPDPAAHRSPPGLGPPARPPGKFGNHSVKVDKKEREALPPGLVPPELPPGKFSAHPAKANKSQPAARRVPPGLMPPGNKFSADQVKEDQNEPEWMQYLSQKLRVQGAKATAAEHVPPKDFSGTRFKRAPLSMTSNTAYITKNMSSVCPDVHYASTTGNLVIHTEEYLKLLRDSKTSFSGAQVPNIASVGGKVKAGKNKISPNLNKWETAFTGEALAKNAIEEDAPGPSTQDDLLIEKVLKDQDLSDPAYWSEAECQESKGRSAHRLGRRPVLAKTAIRSYVMQDLSFELDRTVGMLLNRLQRFTDQHKAFNQEGNVHRRFVIGLKEVARRGKQLKMRCLIVAPDIEQDADSGGLDDRMRELLASAYQNGIPVIFAMSRSRLGRALGKFMQISVIGILDATGAQELMAQSITLSQESRTAWLSRVGK